MFRSKLWSLFVLLALFTNLAKAEDPFPKAARHPIDLVICLDTSNSMDGLIDSAKRRLWDIVTDLAKAKPTPQLRVSLYSYGNDGYSSSNGWVRKELDLSEDLDKVSEKLFGLKTHGGTEYATRVCRDALLEQKWSHHPKALKMIFVCGNEPVNQDREITVKTTAESAVRAGVFVNTIYCGQAQSSEAVGWKKFADLAEGKFIAIDQARGSVAITTPQDKKLAELSGKLNGTYMFYGKYAGEKKANQFAQDSNAAGLGAGAAAQRGSAKASGLYNNADSDLVDKKEKDKNFDLEKLDKSELPEEYRKLTKDELNKLIEENAAKRKAIQDEINKLSQDRAKHIAEEEKKTAAPGEKALHEAVREALTEQAQKRGLDIPK